MDRYNIAGVIIGVRGNKIGKKVMKNEFLLCEEKDISKEVDLKISFCTLEEIERVFKPKYYSLAGKLSFNDTDFMKKDKKYNYCVKNLFVDESTTELYINFKSKSNIQNKFEKIVKSFVRNKGFIDEEKDLEIQMMNYSLFWCVFQMVLLKNNLSFIHSSIVDFNNKGIIIAGTGGCGKTSSTFKLLEKQQTKYIAEDFGILGDNGMVYYNPKLMSIYQTDVAHGQDRLSSYVKNDMLKSDKFFWNFNKMMKGNPMRKISPSKLIGENKISKESEVNKAFYFARGANKNIEVQDISRTEMTERVLHASIRELKILFEILNNIHAVSFGDNQMPLLSDIEEKMRKIYYKAFKNSQLKLVKVPLVSTPETLLKQINLIE